jgi:hypothetical protein
MEIHRVVIDRTKLAAMPESERTLLFLLAHASNEINFLSKLILMARKDDPPSPVHDAAEAGQLFILLRLLTGKLHEAWELFRKRAQRDRSIATTFIPRLESEAAAALQALNRHFGAGSVLSQIRNKMSFHYDDKENLVEASFQQLPESEPLQFYLTQTVGNSFYYAAELIVQLAAINLVTVPPSGANDGASTQARALAALINEIIEVSRDITELFGHLIAMLSENIVSEIITEKVPDGPKLSTFSMPYFFDENDRLPGETQG